MSIELQTRLDYKVGRSPPALYCAHRMSITHLIDYSKLACFSSFGRARIWSTCGRRTRVQMIPQACSFSLQGWELIDFPLRASNEGLLRPRVARAQKIISFHTSSVPGARDQRGCPSDPFHCAHSPGKKGTRLLLCSREEPDCRSLRASREHILIVRPRRARRASGPSLPPP